jgi:signal transduction histidine kinase
MRRLAGITLPLLDSPRLAVRTAARAAFALACAAAGLAAVFALVPLLSRPYYFPAFAAIILPAVVSGGRYGVVTTLAFALGYAWLYLPPHGSLAVKNPHELAALVAYTVTGCFVAAIGGALRRAYADLRDQHRLLDRILAQREDLLRALTHDIRSPLNVIAMNAALLSRTAGEGDPDVRRRTELIQGGVAAVDSMLRDLVEVAALESGQVRLTRATVDLAALIGRLKDGLGGALPASRVQVDVPDGALPPLHADPQRLERVLVNVVANALKYSSGPVTIAARAHPGSVVVSVRDEGPGISPEDLPHIFEKYYRASGARPKEGLGLGLYICRLLVEAHGGRIWAESERGRGSTFRIAIPTPPAEGRLLRAAQPDATA